MGYDLKKNDTTKPLQFLMVSSEDHMTGATHVIPSVTISKNGGPFAPPQGIVAEIGQGWYKLTPTANDLDTLGPITLHASAIGCDDTDDRFRVVLFDPYAADVVVRDILANAIKEVSFTNDAITDRNTADDININTVNYINSEVSAMVTSYDTGMSPSSQILSTPTNKLNTDSSGRVGLQPDYSGIIEDNTSGNGHSTTTFYLNASANANNSFYNGCLLYIPAIKETRVINGYNGISKSCVVSAAFTNTPANGTRYLILRGYNPTVWSDQTISAAEVIGDVGGSVAGDVYGVVTVGGFSAPGLIGLQNGVTTVLNTAIPASNTDGSIYDILLDKLNPRLPASGTIAKQGDNMGSVTSVSGNVGGNVLGIVSAVSSAVTVGGYSTGQSPAEQILTNTSNKIKVNVANQVEASSVQGNVTGSVASVTGNVAGVVNPVTVGTINANVITSSAIADNAITNAKVADDLTVGSVTGNVTVGAYAAGKSPADLVLQTAANKLKTDAAGLVTANGVSGNITGSVNSVTNPVTIGTYSVGQSPADYILVTPANKIKTNASNQVEASSVQGNVTGSVASVSSAVTVGTINANVITSSAIADNAITNAKVADDLTVAGVTGYVSALVVDYDLDKSPAEQILANGFKLTTDSFGRVEASSVQGNVTGSVLGSVYLEDFTALGETRFKELSIEVLNTSIPVSNTDGSIYDILLDKLSPRLPASGTIAKAGDNMGVVSGVSSPVMVDEYATGMSPAEQILVTPANKIKTNASNQVEASSVQGNVTGSVASVTNNVTVGAYAGGKSPADLVLITPANKIKTNGYGQVEPNNVVVSGVIAGATANTITLDVNASGVSGVYKGMTIFLPVFQQSRVIIDYNGSTKVATVDANFDTTIMSTFGYIIYGTRSPKTNASNQVEASSVQGNITGSVASVSSAVTVGTINANVITSSAIQDGAITNAKVADDLTINDLTAVKNQTDKLQFTGAAGNYKVVSDVSNVTVSGDVTVGAYAAGLSPAEQILVTPTNKIKTDASNRVEASSVQGNVTGSVGSVASAVNINSNADIAAIKGQTDKIHFTGAAGSEKVVSDVSNVTVSGNVTVGAYAAGLSPAEQILSTTTNKLVTNASGQVLVQNGTGSGQISLVNGKVSLQATESPVIRQGTSASGHNNSYFYLDAGASNIANKYRGALIYIPSIQESRVITSYDGVAKSCYVYPAFNETPANNAQYIIYAGVNPAVDSMSRINGVNTVYGDVQGSVEGDIWGGVGTVYNFDANALSQMDNEFINLLNTAIPASNLDNSIYDILLDKILPRLPASGTIAKAGDNMGSVTSVVGNVAGVVNPVTVGTINANVITSSAIADNAITNAKVADDLTVGSVTGNVTVGGYAAGKSPADYILQNTSYKIVTDATGGVLITNDSAGIIEANTSGTGHSTTAFYLNASSSSVTGFYSNNLIYIPSIKETRVISNYDGVAKKCTFDQPLHSTPANNCSYQIIRANLAPLNIYGFVTVGDVNGNIWADIYSNWYGTSVPVSGFDGNAQNEIKAQIMSVLDTAIPSPNTDGSINDILLDKLNPRLPASGTIAKQGDNMGTVTGVTNPVNTTANTDITAIKAQTDKIQFSGAAGNYKVVSDASNVTVTGNVTVGGYVAGQSPADLLLATPANKLSTNASGQVVSSSVVGSVGSVSSAVTVGALNNNVITANSIANGAITNDKVADDLTVGNVTNPVNINSNTDITGIKSQTDKIHFNGAAGSEKVITDVSGVTIGAYAAGLSPAEQILLTPANKIKTNLSNQVEASSVIGSVGSVTNAVTVGAINNAAITANSIADGAITNAKVADDLTVGSITNPVTVGALNNNVITSAAIADNAITNAKVADDLVVGSVTNPVNINSNADITGIKTQVNKIRFSGSAGSEKVISDPGAVTVSGNVTIGGYAAGMSPSEQVNTLFNTAIPITNVDNSVYDVLLDKLIPRLPVSGTIAKQGDNMGTVSSVTNPVTVGTLNNNVITANSIADGAITNAKVADDLTVGSVTSPVNINSNADITAIKTQVNKMRFSGAAGSEKIIADLSNVTISGDVTVGAYATGLSPAEQILTVGSSKLAVDANNRVNVQTVYGNVNGSVNNIATPVSILSNADIAAIKTKTDKIQFNPNNEILASAEITGGIIVSGYDTGMSPYEQIVDPASTGLLKIDNSGRIIASSVQGNVSGSVNSVATPVAVNSIAANAITAASITDGAITNAKVTDDLTVGNVIGAVTVGKINDAVITNNAFANNAITKTKVASDIEISKVLDSVNSVTNPVTVGSLGTGAITNTTIADGAITNAKIANNLTVANVANPVVAQRVVDKVSVVQSDIDAIRTGIALEQTLSAMKGNGWTNQSLVTLMSEIMKKLDTTTYTTNNATLATSDQVAQLANDLGSMELSASTISAIRDGLALNDDVTSIKTIAEAIKSTTDKFRFTNAGLVDAYAFNTVPEPDPQTPVGALSSESTTGLYLNWERITENSANIVYQILRAEQFDGIYKPIAEVKFPTNEYIDETGNPTNYYKIRELGPDPNNANSYNQLLAESQPIIGEELLIKASLAFQLRDLLKIPIYDEEGIMSEDRTSANWAYANWNYWPRPEIRITGSVGEEPTVILSENDLVYSTQNGVNNYPNGLKYKIDYSGRAFFLDQYDNPVAIHSYDTVYASYNVRLFTSDEMNNALYMALQDINAQPGTNKYSSVSSAPYFYDPALITGASYYLLRGLLIRLTQRETRLLIQDSEDGSFNTIEMIQDSVKTYKEDFDNFLKTIGKTKYPTAHSIVTPEYMMPGGRSRFFRYIWKGGA